MASLCVQGRRKFTLHTIAQVYVNYSNLHELLINSCKHTALIEILSNSPDYFVPTY